MPAVWGSFERSVHLLSTWIWLTFGGSREAPRVDRLSLWHTHTDATFELGCEFGGNNQRNDCAITRKKLRNTSWPPTSWVSAERALVPGKPSASSHQRRGRRGAEILVSSPCVKASEEREKLQDDEQHPSGHGERNPPWRHRFSPTQPCWLSSRIGLLLVSFRHYHLL